MASAMTSTRAELAVTGLHAGYGRNEVVKGVDITVSTGEIVLLSGANGAGKSTTMKAIAGRIDKTAGSLTLDGEPLPHRLVRRARRGVVLLPEERSIFNTLTAAENLRIGGKDIDAGLDLFPELRDHLHRRAGLLSGGQQRILALARALATRPKILLIDEMTLGLAPIVVSRLLDCLAEITQAHDVGVLLVEQHVRRALRIAARGYVLTAGRIAIAGGVEELHAHAAEIENAYLGVENV